MFRNAAGRVEARHPRRWIPARYLRGSRTSTHPTTTLQVRWNAYSGCLCFAKGQQPEQLVYRRGPRCIGGGFPLGDEPGQIVEYFRVHLIDPLGNGCRIEFCPGAAATRVSPAVVDHIAL